MAGTYIAFGRTITVNNNFLVLLEKNLGELNDFLCEHYLIVEFGQDNVLKAISQYTDEQLSEIVKRQAADEQIVGEYHG
ncbi:MAG: hypothetical protein IJ794_06215 [Lachnospiraceae bacterium]|nr:hypothetical protein [Lachnospiraceae bacterium]